MQAGKHQKDTETRFASAEMLVGNKLIRDYPTALSLSSITLAHHGDIRPSQVQWIKIKGHPHSSVATDGVRGINQAILSQWPVAKVAQEHSKPQSHKEMKQELKRQALKERRVIKRLAKLPQPPQRHPKVSPKLINQQASILGRVMKELETTTEAESLFALAMARDE